MDIFELELRLRLGKGQIQSRITYTVCQNQQESSTIDASHKNLRQCNIRCVFLNLINLQKYESTSKSLFYC